MVPGKWAYKGKPLYTFVKARRPATSAVTGSSTACGIWRNPDLQSLRIRGSTMARAWRRPSAGYARAPSTDHSNPEGTMLQFLKPGLGTAIFGLRLLVAFAAPPLVSRYSRMKLIRRRNRLRPR